MYTQWYNYGIDGNSGLSLQNPWLILALLGPQVAKNKY